MTNSKQQSAVFWAIGLFGLLTLLVCGCGSRPSEPPPTGAAWVSDAALSSQLGPEEQIGGYGIRPPVGYTVQRFKTSYPNPDGLQFDWTGPPGAGGVTPYMELNVDTNNAKEGSHSPSDDEVRAGYDAAAQDHANVTYSQITQGAINGLAFSRGYWKGTGRATGRQFHGMVYGRATSSDSVSVYARDGEPTYQQSLPLMEASILTLRKL